MTLALGSDPPHRRLVGQDAAQHPLDVHATVATVRIEALVDRRAAIVDAGHHPLDTERPGRPGLRS
jgi:hypothetical protein